MKITDLLGKKIIICDGAMGTMFQQYGLKAGELPELLSFTHPEMIKDIYAKYFQAGSDFVSANTFGCNRQKFENTGYTAPQAAAEAVRLAKEAAEEFMARQEKDKAPRWKFAALDLGPMGRLMEPTGDLSFEEAYDNFREVIAAGAAAGADFVLLETFMDIHEMKAAVLAAKESCDLPVFCSVTFEKSGRMLMGTDPHTVVNILQDLGVDALGINCSLGPREMIGLAKEFLAHSRLPVLVQPNAGLPVLVDGEMKYDVDISDYVQAVQEMLRAGVAIVGGCCGTNPDYIAALADSIQSKEDYPALSDDSDERRKAKAVTAVSSSVKTVVFDGKARVVGDGIDPGSNDAIREAVKGKNLAPLRKEAAGQVKTGAELLKVRVGLPEMPESDELELMLGAIKKISYLNVPLQIESASPSVLAAAARYYNGKPILGPVNGEKERMEAVFPIVKKYGACVMAVTQDENGLPQSREERLAAAERIIEAAAAYGIGRERVLADCLEQTVSLAQAQR